MSLRQPLHLLGRRQLYAQPLDIQRRCLATSAAGAADTAKLPLAGIKVLDMTRVLAGVCDAVLRRVNRLNFTDDCTI